MGMIKRIGGIILTKPRLGDSSCINTSSNSSKGFLFRSYTSLKISSNSKHASTILNLTTTQKAHSR